jgi:hypothetical protein
VATPGKRRRRIVLAVVAVPVVLIIAVLLALYPLHKARQDRADERFRQMSIEVRRDLTRFRPAGVETVNRSVVAATVSRAFSSVKAQELLTCPNLAQLDLSHCDSIDADGLARLAALPRVKVLSLAGTPTDDRMLSRLSAWPALDELDLDRTRVSAAGLREFLHRHRLKSVSVNGAGMSPAEVAGLREAFADVQIRAEGPTRSD